MIVRHRLDDDVRSGSRSLFATGNIMNPSLWLLLVALTTWWSVSTVNCGGRECFPYVIFFYSAFWLPVVAYLAGAEALADALSVRWRALTHLRAPIYTLFASAGFGVSSRCYTLRGSPPPSSPE